MEWIANIYKDQSVFVSWLISLAGVILLLLPTILTWRYCKKHMRRWRFTLSFIVFGALAIPLSFWLYFQYFLGPIRALLFGFIGLIMLMFHMAPLEIVSTSFLLEATDTESGQFGTGVSNNMLIGGIMWATAYGITGFIIDAIISFIKPSNNSSNLTGAKDAPPS